MMEPASLSETLHTFCSHNYTSVKITIHFFVVGGRKYRPVFPTIISHHDAIVAVTKMHASGSQQNRTTLQHEERMSGEWRLLRTCTVAKLGTLYCWLRSAWQGSGLLNSFRGLEARNLMTATAEYKVTHFSYEDYMKVPDVLSVLH
jgi:hypothetical protein